MTGGNAKQVPEGQWTKTVYTLITEGKYQECISLLEPQLENFPMNRAALSLLGWCYYYLQDFAAASEWYVQWC
jgi:tetratricopeptide repeat protein 30